MAINYPSTIFGYRYVKMGLGDRDGSFITWASAMTKVAYQGGEGRSARKPPCTYEASGTIAHHLVLILGSKINPKPLKGVSCQMDSLKGRPI